MLHRMNFEIHTQYRMDMMATDIDLITDGFMPTSFNGEKVDGHTYIAQPIEFELLNRHGVRPTSEHKPMLRLDRDLAREFMQAMMNEAWNMGLRPSGVKDLTSTLEATRYHLEDMRQLNKLDRRDK